MAQPSINTLFALRSMFDAIEQWKTPQSFFLDMFFSEIKTHKTRYIEVDFRDGERTIAPFIHRKSSGQLVETGSFDKFIWEPPYVKPQGVITPEDIQEVMIGENVYSTSNPTQRLVQLRNEKLKQLDDMITRREELMAVQSVVNREITIEDENGDATQDAIAFTVTSGQDDSVDWGTPASSTPVYDIRTRRRRIAQRTGLNADVCIHGSTNADNFTKSADTRAILDLRNATVGTWRQERIARAEAFGAIYIGTIDGIDHFSYDEWYKDLTTGTETPMIPTGVSILGCSQAKSVRHYGVIESLNAPVARRWPKFYDNSDRDPENYGIQIHSAPLPVTHQPDAFVVMTQT